MQSTSRQISSFDQPQRKRIRTKSASFYTAAEWDSIKPQFTRLYITEKKSLKEVQRILERDHDFPATKKMLKTHITMWHIGKHRSEKENRHGLKIFRRAERAGRKVSMTIKEIPTTLEDILRHFTKKGIDISSVQSPTSPTPASIEYVEYEEENLESGDEEEDSESDEDEQPIDLSFAAHNTLRLDDARRSVDASSELGVQHSITSTDDDGSEQVDQDATSEIFARNLKRQLTFPDESMSDEAFGSGSDIADEVHDQILESLESFFSETLPGARPQSSYFVSACPGRAALKAFDVAIKKNDRNTAMLQYQEGLKIMERMMQVPNPFCIVYVCELMRIALMNKDAAMPEKMLDYVADLAISPLTIVVSSVMRAKDDNRMSRVRLLGFVYETAMEIIERDAPENEVFKVLNNRYAILCSEMGQVKEI